ncbi:hypothetical protein SLOPH_733, partial [Spraguea lophii 42_110]
SSILRKSIFCYIIGKSLLFNNIEESSDYYLTERITNTFCPIKIFPTSNPIKRILKNLSKFVLMLEIKNKNNETLALCKIRIHQDHLILRLPHSEFFKIIDQHIKYGILYFEVLIPKFIGYTIKVTINNNKLLYNHQNFVLKYAQNSYCFERYSRDIYTTNFRYLEQEKNNLEKKKEQSIASILFENSIEQQKINLFHSTYFDCVLDINQSLEISVKKLFVKSSVCISETNKPNKSLEALKESNFIFEDYISKYKINEYMERYLPIITFKDDKDTKPVTPYHKNDKKNKDVDDEETTQIP